MESMHEMASGRDGSAPEQACAGVAPPAARLPFWQRQFGPQPTLGQKLFDLMAGVMLPMVCIWFDPIVFNGSERGWGGMFSAYALGGYLFIFVEVLVLLLWLLLGRRLAVLSGFVGGMLSAGAFFACLLGIALLPLSLIGLMMFIGVLGLSPFVTSFVFLRNGIRALRNGDTPRRPRLRWIVAVLGAALVVGVPAAAQREVNHIVSRLTLSEGDERPEQRAIEIQCARWVVRCCGAGSVDALVDAYDREEDPDAKKRMADVYHEITGGNIESRLVSLRD
jgi:hypothetical protein